MSFKRPDSRDRKRKQPWYSSKEEDIKEEESGEDTEAMEEDDGEDDRFLHVLEELVGALKTLNGTLSTKHTTTSTTHPNRS